MRTTPDVALRFSPEARSRIATLVAADASGRLAQMARVCPGLLSLLLAFEDAGRAPIARSLIADIQRGRRLNHLLASAVAEWHQVTQPGARTQDAELLHCKGVLLRRAGPRVPPGILWLPPPVELIPEDIPRGALANARWFRVMKSCPELLDPHASPEWRSVARFFSKHAPRLPADDAAELAHFLIAAELIVTRGTALGRVLCDFAGWSEDRPVKRPDTPVSGFGEAYASAELSIRPLTTFGQIYGEGSRMEHCVRSHVLLAKRGIALIFAGRLRGRRITVELRRMRNGTLVLFEARGRRNRHLSPDELAALRPWLDSIHCRFGWLGFQRRPGLYPVRELMESTLDLLESLERGEPLADPSLLEPPEEVTDAWLDEVAHGIIPSHAPAIVVCRYGEMRGVLVALLFRGAGVHSPRFSRSERRRFEDFCAQAYQSGLAFTEVEPITPERISELADALAPRVPPGTMFLFPARLAAPTTPVDISPTAPPHVDQSRPVS